MGKKLLAVVTGGASGIGRACVEEFRKTHHVVVADFAKAEEVASQLGDRATGVFFDAADYASCQNLAQKAAALGEVDVLVHCAGICPPTYRIADLEPDLWRKVMSVNLDGVFYLAKALSPVLRDGGSVVLVASRTGSTG